VPVAAAACRSGSVDLAKQLVEDGNLDELAKVLPLDSAFVDAQFAVDSAWSAD
jgi:hypothetical protein